MLLPSLYHTGRRALPLNYRSNLLQSLILRIKPVISVGDQVLALAYNEYPIKSCRSRFEMFRSPLIAFSAGHCGHFASHSTLVLTRCHFIAFLHLLSTSRRILMENRCCAAFCRIFGVIPTLTSPTSSDNMLLICHLLDKRILNWYNASHDCFNVILRA